MVKVQLKKDYGGQFFTTQTGVIVRKEEIVDIEDVEQFEVSAAIQSGILKIIEDDSFKKKIITDTPTTKTIKEVVNKDNKKKIDETLSNKKDEEKIVKDADKSESEENKFY